ncbi:unnamed protein product [Diatraea saccharalis]|uniref:Uncharacterized protein n=1 Tax=Diatraea saccharalis TaxID=40085 RepID=A0A9N9RA44_9NEOP|nr:unnamed protein product [Diatraea saccharalis]
MQNSNFNFEKAFFVTTTALRFGGTYHFKGINILWAFRCLIFFTVSFVVFIFTSNAVLFYDIPSGNFYEASKNGAIGVVAINIMTKYLFLFNNRKLIQDFIDLVNKDYEVFKKEIPEEKEIVIKYSKKGARVSTYWLIINIVLNITAPLTALLEMSYYYFISEFKFVPVFDLRYPTRLEIIKETQATFSLLFIFWCIFGVCTAVMLIGFEPLIPIFLTHVCGQLDILSRRMLEIFSHRSDICAQDRKEKLKQINVKLQELYK